MRCAVLQAMMELGATVCTQAPDCAACPINGQCQAYASVEEHRLSGGDPLTAPCVTAYPEKVPPLPKTARPVTA